MHVWRPLTLFLICILALTALASQRAALQTTLFNLTGEENFFSQLRAVGQLTLELMRPPLDLQPDVAINHNGVNPFGINAFLQHEVEPAKRARQAQLIAEAGFYWVRQEFPWADIEISARGNFEDCRFPPCHSAWEKYDHIVALSEQYGLHLIARLSSPPDWARAEGAARGAFAPPDDFTDFANFAVAVAERYRGRIQYFQIWNEPNGNDEWGYQPVDAVAYTALLCETYARLKAVDPDLVVLAAALTPTNELGDANPNGLGGNNLNDLVYLQQMYAAGARDCFDVMSVQGYGLFSGPHDHRLQPLLINYGRHQLIRDVMVKNGDAAKALWIAEMNWNAVPEGMDAPYGRVTLEQQARYATLAYTRAQAEWPWVGATAFWFFKRADDSEKNQPWYYFRMMEPDFTPLPVYAAMQTYTRQPARMRPGWYQEDHWAVAWDANWVPQRFESAWFAHAQTTSSAGATARFAFEGTALSLVVTRQPSGGELQVTVDGVPHILDLHSATLEPRVILPVVRGLAAQSGHWVEIVHLSGASVLDGFIVRRAPDNTGALALAFGVALVAAWIFCRRRAGVNG